MTDSPLIAKKYPISGKLKGSYYGNPEISSILAGFESDLLDLHRSRPYYKATSVAWYKHQDHIRLKVAQAIMDYKATQAIAAKLEQVDVTARVDEQNKLTAFIGNNSGQPNFLNLVSSYNSERYAQLTKEGNDNV